MATKRFSILNQATLPGASGNCFREPLPVVATNDLWRNFVWKFKNIGALRIALHGLFNVPKDYVGTAKIIVIWSSVTTTGNIVWDFDYRTAGGDDAESLDQATAQESVTVTDAAPTAALNRLAAQLALTSANLAADDTVQFTLFRDKSDAADTLAADAVVADVLFEYADA